MRFAIAIPQGCPDGSFSPHDFRSYFARVEELGVYESAWTQDSTLGPAPSLWFGGSAEAAVRRGVRLCDAFFGAGSSTTAAFASQVAVVRESLARAGRTSGFGPGEFPIAKRIYIGIDPSDGARARSRVNDALAAHYGQRVPAIEAATVAGTLAECVADVRAVIAAGAEMILFTPMYDVTEHMELIAAELIPALG
jgi:alkanesulfonate monooxygenase SsuD/methylene tetrahydromethanopterin reductase-like flavin-dependent oxidoreductase (luciferase family)